MGVHWQGTSRSACRRLAISCASASLILVEGVKGSIFSVEIKAV